MDLDNLPKGMLDALTHAGVWGDDSQIDDLQVTRQDCQGKPGHVVFTMREL
jgi:crossover junction endodeoxyribonuclease RusA